MNSAARSDLIRDLKERLRRWEGLDRHQTGETVCSTGVPELDRMLPRGGFGPGALFEWLSVGAGAGTETLTLLFAARLLDPGGVLVVIDERREFYPPGAACLGIDLDRTVVVQPRSTRDALWAFEQSLRCPAASVVLGWSERAERADRGGGDRALRRLQLAAEAGGGIGFVLRPETCRGEPSWAEARLLVQALPGGKNIPAVPGRRLRIELLHGRGGFGGEALTVELTHATHAKGHVHLAAALADPAPAGRAHRA